MPRTKNYEKIIAKLEAEIAKLEKQVCVSFEAGYKQANKEIQLIEMTYDKYIDKCTKEFERREIPKLTKNLYSKIKKAGTKKAAVKKPVAKKKKAPAKTVGKRGRGRPAKKAK